MTGRERELCEGEKERGRTLKQHTHTAQLPAAHGYTRDKSHSPSLGSSMIVSLPVEELTEILLSSSSSLSSRYVKVLVASTLLSLGIGTFTQ